MLLASATACDHQSNSIKAEEGRAETKAGDPLPGLTGVELSRFSRGRFWFEWFFVPGEGLGPVFNDVSCLACHGVPASGGGHPAIKETRFRTATTVQFPASAADQAEGAPNLNEKSVSQDFASPGCDVAPEHLPDSTIAVTVRTTPALFGAGLIEAIPDQTLIDNGQAATRDNPEISGVPALSTGELPLHRVQLADQTVPGINTSELSTGAVARFGARGLTTTLQEFVHMALFNELGMTTPHPKFGLDPRPMGLPAPPACKLRVDPEMDLLEVQRITDFVRFLAPPPRGPITPETTAGEALFAEVGCAGCHTPVLMTGDSPVAAIAHQPVPLYSDLLLHDMGPELSDDVLDGSGGASEWRTPALWGLGLRVKPLMHDGRAGLDIQEAIRQHGGEASNTRDRFFGLDGDQQQLVIRFLLSL